MPGIGGASPSATATSPEVAASTGSARAAVLESCYFHGPDNRKRCLLISKR